MSDQQKCRCPWADPSKLDYVAYHDEEWGVPVYDDKKLFEFLILESAQAGLSWYTILKRRDGYRQAFADFDVEEVASYTAADVERLVQDTRIIRNRAKIEAAINNAKCFIAIQKEFGSFSHYMWSFVDHKPIVNRIEGMGDYPATSEISDKWSKDLKKRGFKFVGSTICYAHMQACGMVNDHILTCYRRQQIIDSYSLVN
ncbi:DNA-3-methyladenine glycosylase I [Thalassotalea agarivorans]|uniref:DNA-3-methyladenine glycosylase I n=1 Tax=Thalassotalea agarivorans TaxID=349064 RepID=A0A1I0F180_THASX|nr:DNA-3-methyladenine glycosylase I [Thalassotalea agarivorans]SET50970.1 DNA-3-methyladenine glycosylase I [Thalassotalea agarivorans]